MKIGKKRNGKGAVRYILPGSVESLIDPGKAPSLLAGISTGITNSILLQRFPGFIWPAWVTDASNKKNQHTPYANPLLLNTTNRSWQTLTNYLSEDELKIDETGMISGPGGSCWSVEFWLSSKNSLICPQHSRDGIVSSRNALTGEILVAGSYKNISFQQNIAGGKSNINEAVILYKAHSKSNMADSVLLVVIRPYNMTSLGGIDRIEFIKGSNAVAINGRVHIATASSPDFVLTGSGNTGDIVFDQAETEGGNLIECEHSMATMALCFKLSGNTKEHQFRISLEPGGELAAGTGKKYHDCLKDFGLLCEMRRNEGIVLDTGDERGMNIINQSLLSMLNIHSGDLLPLDVFRARNSYFFIYALVRAGQIRESENIFRLLLANLSFNEKQKDFETAVIASYIASSFNEIYIHKREAEFLQQNFQTLRRVGDYIYSFCSEIHSLSRLNANTLNYNWINQSSEHDFFIFYYAMSSMAYLARCMGIFGHESKYKNEADRLQAIIRDSYEKKKSLIPMKGYDFKGLLSFPERLFVSTGEEEYNKLFRNLFISDDFPIIERIYGLDLMSSFIVLNQMLLIRDARFGEFFNLMFSRINSLFSLPEYIDPATGRGAWGEGNSKSIASMIFVIMRNMVFIDSTDRLELFPVPDEKMFNPGGKIKIENAPSRFGMLSFTMETTGTEIKIIFTGLPKYIPSDIRINLPYDTKLIEGDDFILKKKINHSYLINGWPSSVRFQIL